MANDDPFASIATPIKEQDDPFASIAKPIQRADAPATSGPIGAKVPEPEGLQGAPTPYENNKVALSNGLVGMGKSVADTMQAIHSSNTPKDPTLSPTFSASPAQGALDMDTTAQGPDEAAGKIAGTAAQMAIPLPGAGGTVSRFARGVGPMIANDAEAAALKGLNVGAKSKFVKPTLDAVAKAKPYLKGVESLEELQQRIPVAKQEIWEPYQKALDKYGFKSVQGPDGPTTLGQLEQDRLQASALNRGIKSRDPAAIQTAMQKGMSEADSLARERAIQDALDPELEKLGIDPKGIRSKFGAVARVGSKVAGRSTIAEPNVPSGLGTIANEIDLRHPLRAPGAVLKGAKEIAAGQPLLKMKATDQAVKDAFKETDTFDGKTSAGAQVPSEVTALLHRTGAKITNNEAPTSQSVASVSPDDPNTINIDDKERFDKDKNAANQTLSHEAVHVWHNNLPPEIQKMIPMDDPKDPYHGDGYEPDELKQMRSLGVKLWNLPRERAATIIQKYAHMGGDNAPKEIKEAYGPWAKDLVDSPLSTVQQTSADQPGINTAVRPPAPMQEMKIFGEGEGKPEKEDTPNGKREVLHGSKDRESLVEEAKAEAPHLEKGLKAVADQNKGAKFDAVRGEKSEGRLTEKIKREGQPVETVPDVLAGRIAVDSDEAKDAVVSDLKKHATVVREKDEFKSGDSRFGFHAHKLQVKVSPKLSAEVQVVPKETAAQDDKQHPLYKQARTAELDGDTGKAKELASKAKEMNDGAKSRFDLRNKEKDAKSGSGNNSGSGAKGPSRDVERGSVDSRAKARGDDGGEVGMSAGSGAAISSRAGDSTDKVGDRNKEKEKDALGMADGRGMGKRSTVERDSAAKREDDSGGDRKISDGGSSSGHRVGDRVTMPDGKPATVAYAPSKSSQLPTYRFKTDEGKQVEMRARDAESKVKKAPDDVSGTVLVDLDQTLAHRRAGRRYIGAPEPAMVERIQKDLAAGKRVEIFTASVAEDPTGEKRKDIEDWSRQHIGRVLPVTDKKMPGTGEILDDKAKQVKNGKVMA